MNDFTIVGIGYKKFSGKDTTADYLVQRHGFTRISFADSLKSACGIIFSFSDEQLYGDEKEVFDSRWGKTPREILQLVGTEGIRNVIDPDVWIKSAMFRMQRLNEAHPDKYNKFVVADVRFPNEAEFIRNFNQSSSVWKINRNLPENLFSKHSSETSLDDYPHWNAEIDNNSTLESLYQNVDKLFDQNGKLI